MGRSKAKTVLTTGICAQALARCFTARRPTPMAHGAEQLRSRCGIAEYGKRFFFCLLLGADRFCVKQVD
jgi:hypothetical protein